jgi:Fe-S-cluster-containing dehydrogenase component
MSEKLWQKYYGKPNPIYGNKRQYGMLLDLNKCLGCHTCTMACKTSWTDGPGQADMYWNSVNTKPFGAYPRPDEHAPDGLDYENPNMYQDVPKGIYPDLWQFYMPRPCNHCARPACLPACPTQAIYKNEDGIVLIDQDVCQGYRNCIKACPYDKIYFNSVTKKSQKCVLCFPLIEKGQEPQCVKSCVGKIRVFGDLMDPNSTISRLIRDPSLGAKAYEPEKHFKAVTRYMTVAERRQYRPDFGPIPSLWYVLPKNVPQEELEKYFGTAMNGLVAEPHSPEARLKYSKK